MSGYVSVAVDGWSTCELDVTIGAGNDTWTPSDDAMTVVSAVGDLVGWLNAGGRPWSGSATFSISLLATLSPWTGVQITCSTSCTYAPNARLQSLLDWPASGQSATSIYTVTGIDSTIDCRVGLGGWLPRVEGAGATARAGSFLLDSQAYALRPGRLELIGNEAQFAALGVAIAGASDPVWLHLMRSRDDLGVPWELVYPGELPRPARSGEVYSMTVEVYG